MLHIGFWGVHLGAVAGLLWVGWSWTGFALMMALYFGRMFFLTAGYHRYFSHRAFKTSRIGQFVFALGGTLAAQRGVLWWAATHRRHHKYSDTAMDVHSPRVRGLWWSHLGWVLSAEHRPTEWDRIRDLSRYPELRWLDRHTDLPVIALGVVLLLTGGVWALVWGLASTVLLWHGTFAINSLAHLIGTRPYQTGDDSRNNFFLALMTMGEGWHNNHHHFQSSTRQGFRWWQLDLTYYVLLGLARLGLVWDLRAPPHRQPAERQDREAPAPAGAALAGA